MISGLLPVLLSVSAHLVLAKYANGTNFAKNANGTNLANDTNGTIGFWCQGQDFNATESVLGLSDTTRRVRARLGSNTTERLQRVAVLVRGDAYRNGGIKSNRNCDPSQVNKTIVVFASLRARVIRPLRAAGYEVDVFEITYNCTSDPSLNHLAMAFLQPWLRRSYFIRDRSQWNQARVLQEGLQAVMNVTLEQHMAYDGILVLRFDTVVIVTNALHDLTTLSGSADAILFTFSSPPAAGLRVPYVLGDTFLWIPWLALPCFVQAMHSIGMPRCFNSRRPRREAVPYSGHQCYPTLIKQFQSAPMIGRTTPEGKIGVMTGDMKSRKYTSDSASRKGGNPLYITVPRSFGRVLTFLKRAKDVQHESDRGQEVWMNMTSNRTSTLPMLAATQMANGDTLYDFRKRQPAE